MTEFKLTFLTDYSDEGLLDEVRRVAREANKKPLSRAEFRQHARVGISTLTRRFGSWRATLAKAGLEELTPHYGVLGRSDEELIDLVRKVAADLRRKELTADEFADATGLQRGAVPRRFGSWKQVMRLAGLSVCAHGRRYSDKECFENLLEVWTRLGRCPKYQEMNAPPSSVGPKAYIVRWGTWRKALAAFVEWANDDEADAGCEELTATAENPVPLSDGRAAVAPEDRREPTLRDRFRVLQRDHFRCISCGRSPATHPGVVILHVDHIVPFCKGGKTVLDNLRSLCQDCNLGKGDMLPDG